MKNSDVYVLSSLWEEVGFVIVEAAINNLYLISSDCPNGPKEFLKDLDLYPFDICFESVLSFVDEFILGIDESVFDKKNEFIIYQGSHGDKGAEIADIILPGATYTEQNGFFTNLEGKLQKAYKASYPPGEAKEDWQIINELAEYMNNRKLFNDKDELDSSMLNYLNLQKENSNSSSFKAQNNENFKNEDLKIEYKDYYFSNVIARSSKTMLDCHNSKLKIKRTGTDG